MLSLQGEFKESATILYDADERAPANIFDPVIKAYKKELDIGLIRESLKRSVEERI